MSTKFLFGLVFMALGFELTACCLLGSYATTPSAHFALVVLQIGSWAFCPGQPQTIIFLLCLQCN
jgi:hypothetical protein